MDNNDTRAGWQYHEGTKHPKGALLNPWHRFDPASQPLLYKQYLDVEAVPLPEIQAPAGLPALAVLAGAFGKPSEGAGLDINVLAGLLFYSAGITKRIRYPWGEMAFRAAACTGALYHIELYVVCGDLPGLPAGVYHFDPIAMALDILRKGDYRAALVQASGGEPSISKAPAVIVYSDVFWRNACKYQARAYRHSFWDSGTIVAHSRAIAGAYSLPARLVLGFVDEAVNQLLGLEDRKEAALALMAIGEDGPDPSGSFPDVKELAFITRPVSRFELDFPAIHDMHAASSLREPAQVRAWREGEYPPPEILPVETVIPLDPLAGGELPIDPVGKVILRRGSARRFARDPISFRQLSTLLAASTGEIPLDYRSKNGEPLNRLYLTAHAVEGLPPGAYVFEGANSGLGLLKEGEFRQVSGSLGLGQALAADASVNIFFLADLAGAFRAYGNRGYRLAQMEASITAGRVYLAAYALSLGATGLTFYDDQVVSFFSPHAADRGVMFLIALGVPVRKTGAGA